MVVKTFGSQGGVGSGQFWVEDSSQATGSNKNVFMLRYSSRCC